MKSLLHLFLDLKHFIVQQKQIFILNVEIIIIAHLKALKKPHVQLERLDGEIQIIKTYQLDAQSDLQELIQLLILLEIVLFVPKDMFVSEIQILQLQLINPQIKDMNVKQVTIDRLDLHR